MIKCHLSKILGAKRMSMKDLAELANISRNTVFLLYHEKTTRLDYNTLNSICGALDCQPGDILEYIPDNK